MKVLYFTATGNSLQVAKGLGNAELLSIPQMIRDKQRQISDETIGLVFPCYSGGLPLIVKKFLSSVKLEATYLFAVITYGDMLVSAPRQLERFAQQQGLRFDYINAVCMTDTYLPMYETSAQVSKLPEKRVEERIGEIAKEIRSRRRFAPKAGIVDKAFGAMMRSGAGKMLGGAADQRFRVSDSCTSCGICAKVCPVGNIQMQGSPAYQHHCEGCLACIHHCPSTAIHIEKEKSAARFRNPTVSLDEIVRSNCQYREID